LHAFLFRGQCSIWQSLPQYLYLTSLHAAHAFNFMPSFSSLPQLAQAAATSCSSVALLYFLDFTLVVIGGKR
jgi:hypothetical protein